MGKVHQRVVNGIANGRHIANTVATDHLITSGVSNWGGNAFNKVFSLRTELILDIS